MHPPFEIPDTPGPPSAPRVVDTTKHSISLAWTKPMYDGGTDIIGYVLEMQEKDTDQWYRVHTNATIRNAEFTVTDLKMGQKYSFRVAAVNVKGMSEYSESTAEIEPVERLGICHNSFQVNYFLITPVHDLIKLCHLLSRNTRS